MTSLSTKLEIFIPEHERVPEKIQRKLPGDLKRILDNSVPLNQYVQPFCEEVHNNLRRFLPELRLFRNIIVYPWEENMNKQNIKIYTLRIRVAGCTGIIHPPYILGIKLTFREIWCQNKTI